VLSYTWQSLNFGQLLAESLLCRILLKGGHKPVNKRMTIRRLATFFFLFSGAAIAVHAQSSPSPAGNERGFVFYESFEGDSNSDGQVMILSSSATYHLNQHFSAGVGIPIYFDHANSSTTGASSASGIGNVFATVRAVWKSPFLNYGTALTGTAPTGDSKKGLSTGHATFDWDNRVNHDFGVLTPFVDLGAGNSIMDTRYFLRPFSSYGYLAHFEAGTDVDLTHALSLTLSGYDIAPWGTQTVISRVVAAGAPGKSGSVTHGRAFENSHLTTGTSSLTNDDGFNAGLSFSPKPYLDLDLGYTRSVRYALNSVSFGVGVNLSSLFGKNNQSGK
jgi:hypothetical protein